MAEWTFITNYAMVLMLLAKKPRVTAIDVSHAIGITERATRKIIADLDTAGYITKKKEGRRVRYRVNPEMFLRGQTSQDVAVGELLEVLGWKWRRKKTKSKDGSIQEDKG